MRPLLFCLSLLLWNFGLFKTYRDPVYVAYSAVLVHLMHARLFQSTSIVWLCAWTWFFIIFHSLLNKNRPWFWHVFWAAVIFGLREKMRPDSSLEQFLTWTASLWGLRFSVMPLQAFYSIVGDRGQSFPFSIISPWWRLSKPLWRLAGTERRLKKDLELCGLCRGFISRSSLILGSRSPFSRLVEWHKVWASLEELRASAENDKQPCHICKLVWYSVSETRRQKLWGDESARTSSTWSFGIYVWEERPLSLYTYIQLYHNWKAVGGRLLAHRGALFEEPASAAIFQPSTASRNHVELARTWIKNCQSYHTPCKDTEGVLRTMPTRLLYVEPSSSDPPIVKLKEIAKEETQVEYLAFSHCWGGSQTFRLLPDNYSSALRAIDFSELSKNAQDAVSITRALGFSYIWIDSVCIIQGPDGDWATEAPKMGDVYSGAVCTIASTGSPSGDGGCYHERDAQSLLPCIIDVESPKSGALESIYIRRDDVFNFERYVDRAPLNKRAWAVQERLLSPRILHFSAEMLYWECRCRSASELAPNGYTYTTYYEFGGRRLPESTGVALFTNSQIARMADMIGREKTEYGPPPPAPDPDDRSEKPGDGTWQSGGSLQKREIRSFSGDPWAGDASRHEDRSGIHRALGKLLERTFSIGPELDKQGFSNCWYEVVTLYSRGNLTFESDKLVALSGVAREIQKATGLTYMAGLWKQFLLTDLLWYVMEGPGRRLERNFGLNITATQAESDTRFTNAPTWSWASLEGVIGLDLNPNSPQEVLKIEEALARTGFGPGKDSPEPGSERTVPEGALILTGRLCHGLKMKGNVSFPDAPFWEHATIFRDTAEGSIWDEVGVTRLSLLAILLLSRTSTETTKEIQGLVLRYTGEGPGSREIFQRVGLFKVGPSSKTPKGFEFVKESPVKTVYVI